MLRKSKIALDRQVQSTSNQGNTLFRNNRKIAESLSTVNNSYKNLVYQYLLQARLDYIGHAVREIEKLNQEVDAWVKFLSPQSNLAEELKEIADPTKATSYSTTKEIPKQALSWVLSDQMIFNL